MVVVLAEHPLVTHQNIVVDATLAGHVFVIH